MVMRRVIVESPFAGDVERNVAYARACLADCLHRGEAPLASHLLYTQPGVLDDDKPDERALGIEAGLVWGALADATVVYSDLGISRGMAMGVARARSEGRTVEFRALSGYLDTPEGDHVTTQPKLPTGPELLSAAHQLVLDDHGSQAAVANALGISRQLYWQRLTYRCSMGQALAHALQLGVLARTTVDGTMVVWRASGEGEEVEVVHTPVG